MNDLRDGWTMLRDAIRVNAPLRWALLWQAVLLACSVIAMPFDRRIILGLNPWIKPMKFEISVIIYLLTVAVMLYGLRFHRSEEGIGLARSRRWLGIGFALCMTVENTLIALQSARGVRSHMNYTSLLNGVIFGAMGQFIALNTLLVLWLLVLWCVVRVRTPPAVTWGVRLGLVALLLGSLEGALIVMHGAHTVGAPDGLTGLPFLNWSREHGDMRVAHFFAMHALQIMPLAGLWLSRTRLSQALQVAGVWAFSLLYAGGVGLIFAQAMQGHPLLRG